MTTAAEKDTPTPKGYKRWHSGELIQWGTPKAPKFAEGVFKRLKKGKFGDDSLFEMIVGGVLKTFTAPAVLRNALESMPADTAVFIREAGTIETEQGPARNFEVFVKE